MSNLIPHMPTLSETYDQTRKVRARVYGECTDENWMAVRDNWVKPDSFRWLEEKARQPLKDYTNRLST